MLFTARHLLSAVVLHLALLVLLAGGFQFSRKVVPPAVVEAVLFDPTRQDLKQRQDDLRRRAAEQKRRKELEEKKRAEDERRKKEEEESRRQKDLAEKKRAEDARKQKEEERRLKEQMEREETKRREDLERAMREETMRRQLEQEERARVQGTRDLLLARWVTQIRDKVERNWIRPPGTSGTFQCRVRVSQLPGGQITNVRIVESCGNAALDRSVENAVRRSDPLPVAPDPAVFQREIDFHFKPVK